jgi:uncharacterized protein (TIGR02117 family)
VALLGLPLAACLAGLPATGPPGAVPPRLIHVVSDGWHSAIVLERADVRSAGEPWDLAGSRYVELGWGDQVAYTAHRMTSGLGLHAAFRSTSSALYVAGFSVPVLERFPGLDVVVVSLEPWALDGLSDFVRQSFARDRFGHVIRAGSGYADESAFFVATGRYHLFSTCNTWVARALRAAGRPIIPGLTHTASQLMIQAAAFGTVLQSRAP